MEKSLFVKFAAFFTAIATGLVEKINGKTTPLTYLHKEMLQKEITTDLKWQSLNIDGSAVSADIVSMDSELPLKRRDSFGTASGDVPKLGLKLALNEKTLSDIDILQNRNVETKTVVGKIFDDTKKAIVGVYEKLEYMFLYGLSNGVILIDDDTNTGTGIRLDFNYPTANKFGASVKWSDVANAKPIDDIKRVVKIAKAKGTMPTILMMDEGTFDNLAANQQTREQYAFNQNFVGTQIPVPDLAQVNTLMKSKFNLTIKIVDRTVVVEKNGKRTVTTPWASGKIIFLESERVGKLVYGILAEDTRRNPAVMYTKVDDFILVKKWHENEPFSEWTSSQALVLPVINNVDSIYTLDSEEAATDVQVEGDANFTYKGVSKTKVAIIAALTLAEPKNKLTTSSTDAAILAAINKLSDEQILIFEANI